QRMAKRARRRRTLRDASVALAVAVGIALGGFAWWKIATAPPPARPAPRPQPTAAARAADGAPREDAAAHDSAARAAPHPSQAAPPVAAAPADRGTAPLPQPTAAGTPAAGATTVSVLVRPYAQRALLDGVEIASGAQQVRFTLAPGHAHRIQIEHACCAPFVREFAADERLPPTLELRVPLQPRPARLRVEAAPQSRVFVDGAFVGTAGESQRSPIQVSLPGTGASPYEADSEVRIEQPGRRPHVTTARFRAGADVTVVAPLTEPARPEPVVADPDDAAPATTRNAGGSAPERTP
ncbi:MAG TPA: serine/threonine protein kinase, partial [Anaeromyxobacteraceae bacterium]|nr:serine/threonine protein kinase [Anaeromyxobacteraceae bacterium]